MTPSVDLTAAHSPSEVVSSGRPQFWLRVLVLICLFSTAAVYEAVKLSAVTTPEVWVHLRTGLWILQHRAIPRVGLFSQYPDLRWNDSTWGFDAILGGAYHLFGLRCIPILLVVLKVALAVVTFFLARASRASFWVAVGLCGIAQIVIPHLLPLPYVFSILFFAIELRLLARSRETGSAKDLFWLPVLFVLWANLHIQFVTGLLLLGLFLGAVLLERALKRLSVKWLSERISTLELKPVAVVAALSLLATFANPYGFRLLPAAFKILYSPVAFEHFAEMSSMSFRHPQEYALMLLVMAAFLSLGRRRSLELFELMTLIAGTAVAFRIERDGWLVVLPAIAVLSAGFRSSRGAEAEPARDARRQPVWAIAVTMAVVTLSVLFFVPGPNILIERVSKTLPVKACDYIRANRLSQPLFNAYSWGSFLTWYLPEYPGVIDNRVELYGDEILGKYFDVVGGKELLESDPTVSRAGTLLLERESAMAKALIHLPALSAQYRLVYSDDIASVYVPKNGRVE